MNTAFRKILIGVTAAIVPIAPAIAETFQIRGSAGANLNAVVVASFDEPWAMAFLPDKRLLVTTKPGKLFLAGQDGTKIEISGVPKVDYGGQGGFGPFEDGLGDVITAK